MNRIKLSPLAGTVLDKPSGIDSDSSVFSTSELADAFRRKSEGVHSLFVPMHYEKKYAYPLIVWLHGDSSGCEQLQQLMPAISVRNHVAIAPQSGFADQSPTAWPNCEESAEAAYESVLAAVDTAMLRCNINAGRVFIAGSGSGGTMAFRIAFERPDIFAGVISIDGPMDVDQVPLRDWERCRELPVLLSSFRASDSYTQEDLCHHLRLLHIAGFSTTVRQYPGEPNLCDQVLGDVNRWIMEQIGSAIL